MPHQLSQLLRRLAEWQPHEDAFVTSVFIDHRPEESGERPGERSASIILRDRLREIEKSLQPRGPALDSFLIDKDRIEAAYEDADPAARGVAILSCGAADLFEVLEVGTPFETMVAFERYPVLFPIARLLDEFEPALVAVADTNTLRIFSVNFGETDETGGRSEDSVHFQRTKVGGWSQPRYQRHIDKHRSDFAAEAAQELAQALEDEGATRVILAGDEVAIPLLRDALPNQVSDRLVGPTLRLDIRAGTDDVYSEVAEVLAAAEQEQSHADAEALLAEVAKEEGLGVTGTGRTKKALERGQAAKLVILDGFEPLDVREEVTRMALLTDAEVQVVDEHEGLAAAGGVGAILRYRV